jgi:uroporphyrinogen-III decarboxylase
MPTNREKEVLWRAYREGKPTRVPMSLAVNARVVVLDPAWNPKGFTFQEYFSNAAVAVEVQLAFMKYQSQYLNQYTDGQLGRPATWAFYVDNQNTYDSAYFGAPVEFRDGQVADVSQVLAGGGKNLVFQQDIEHPLENPFVKLCLKRHEDLKAAVARLPADGIQYSVNPPLLGFDGPFTIATNLRGSELLSDLYEDPPYVQRLMEFIQQGALVRNKALHKLFGKDYTESKRAGLADDSIQLISTEMYVQRVLPLHQRWFANWSVEGPHSMHLCGDVRRHLTTIHRRLNVRSFDTGFPLDHGAVRKELGEQVEIFGGPEVSLLLAGTPAQVYERTRAILQSGVMAGGKFVLKEANNLPPRVPEANLAGMYRCCQDNGRYVDD